MDWTDADGVIYPAFSVRGATVVKPSNWVQCDVPVTILRMFPSILAWVVYSTSLQSTCLIGVNQSQHKLP